MNWHLVWTSDNLFRLFVGDLAKGAPGGLLLTVVMGIIGIVGGTILGTFVALLRSSPRPWLNWPASVYIQFLRNVPLLILIFWFFFVPPYFGYPLSKFTSVTVALIVFTAAYVAEILRGGIRTVSAGTLEGARALGLNRFQVIAYVVLPIAFHTMIPSLTGRYITAVKNTSLAYLIGFSELTEIGREISARVLIAPIEIYSTVLIMYFGANRLLSAFMRWLEDRRHFNLLFVRL